MYEEVNEVIKKWDKLTNENRTQQNFQISFADLALIVFYYKSVNADLERLYKISNEIKCMDVLGI